MFRMNAARLLAFAFGVMAFVRLCVNVGTYRQDPSRYQILLAPGFSYPQSLRAEFHTLMHEGIVGPTIYATAVLVECVVMICVFAGTMWWIWRVANVTQTARTRSQFLQATLDALPGKIAVVNEFGVIVDTNSAWRTPTAETNGLPKDTGANLLAGYEQLGGAGSEHAMRIAAGLRNALKGAEENVYLEYSSGAADNHTWSSLRASPFKVPGMLYVAVLNEDITARVKAEQTVRTAKEEAERANAAKSAFLANMSHELRTPLTAILGYAEMLAAPQQPSEDRIKSAQIIRRNGEHLLALINDILDLSKIEACRMTVDKTVVDLPQLITEVIALTRQRATRKNLNFELKFDGPIPRTIRTDALRLRQVLVNLIGNAIKFTRMGSITLTVSRNITYFNHQIRFDVKDSGIGMSPQQVTQLFQSFSQADASTTRRFGGTGLGLAISRKLANLLDGDISVQSEEGTGSTFTVVIDGGPRQGIDLVSSVEEAGIEIEAAPVQEEVEVQLVGRILLAEDGIDNQELLATHLRDAGAEVIVVDNGKAAFELGKIGRFDLVFMDMQMPEMDGYEATRRLRECGFTTPIVALTANAMSEDRGRCLAAGCTDYLSKPIDRLRLLQMAAQHLKQSVIIGIPKPTAVEVLPEPQRADDLLVSIYAEDPKFSRLLKTFIGRLPERVQKLSELSEEEDWLQLRQAAHQLKGAGLSYGFAALSEQAATTERAIDGGELSRVKEEVDHLIDLIRHVSGYGEAPPQRESTSEAA